MPHEMEKREAPKTPAQRIQEMFKGWVKEFSKTIYVYPVSLAIAAAVYYLVITYASGVCLIGLVTPLLLLGLLWMFNIRSGKRLALVGLVAFLVFSGVWLASYTVYYGDIKPEIAVSENGKTLTNGTVTPLYGSSAQEYNFTITVDVNTTTGPAYFKNVTVGIIGVRFPSGSYENKTMTLSKNDTANHTQDYYYETTIGDSINAFLFWASYPNGSTLIAARWTSVGSGLPVEGPISSDSAAVAFALLPYAFYQTFLTAMIAYFLLLGMIWWTRRARTMRERQIDKWKKEEAEKEAAKPKTQLKVPSLAKAMGTDKGEGETFVCSECGADVPADATVCPKCGERFD